ncbi:hypothetical protein LTR78_008294 [Recurvomyces mirabilis]|uniref:Inheritance of peroxisomes protein 1 n=1 Tax=Recurvomyces mirabilis TaxID=574656 RepID=A0AAE0TT99_9PEZI|nr:hypothetical protein LTR78_008294 [Recurvomyces mirabilis]
MANTAPVTPETPRRVALNRSFTVPSKIATTSRTGATAEIGATGDIETLYVHPRATIVKFSCSSRPSSSSSPRAALSSGSGSLSWTSPTERTLASGGLEIYRVPGSVAFLHSGSLLHAILPRSQCWCVDKVSRFALRVLPDTYYRVDLPGETPEDLEKVEELKVVLAKVLFYERTACPFNRGEEEALPTAEELDVRKKTRRRSHGPAKKWRLERGFSWRPEDGEEPLQMDSDGSRRTSDASSDDDTDTAEDHERSAEEAKRTVPSTPSRPSGLAGMRSVTAPLQAASTITPSKLRTSVFLDELDQINIAHTTRLNPERLRSVQQVPTDMPPSPPDSSAGLNDTSEPAEHGANVFEEASAVADEYTHTVDLANNASPVALMQGKRIDAEQPKTADRGQDSAPANNRPARNTELEISSEQTVASGEIAAVAQSHESISEPLKVKPSDESHEIMPLIRQRSAEDPYAAIQARILARRSIGGTTSFYPRQTSPPRSSTSSNSSIATLASRASVQQQQNIASALVKKACAVFLGPPAQLVAIMLRIAARFTSGAMGFSSYLVYESPAGTKRVPGSFNLESLDADDLAYGEYNELDEWEEDDFGVPLRSPVRLVALASEAESVQVMSRKGWDVD